MTTKEIENRCIAKQQELLEKYFGNLAHEAAYERPETIGDYVPELPLKMEAWGTDHHAMHVAPSPEIVDSLRQQSGEMDTVSSKLIS